MAMGAGGVPMGRVDRNYAEPDLMPTAQAGDAAHNQRLSPHAASCPVTDLYLRPRPWATATCNCGAGALAAERRPAIEGAETPKMIGWAVKQMWNGDRVRRAGWNGKGMWIAIQKPDAHSKMTEPYIYMRTVHGGLIPWLCSQADLLAIDWEVVDGD